jgi:predicted regulator of Ras-like GTPase activity (Roadblock/LC7/MglB family)
VFESTLKKLVGEVEGALGAAVLSLDGLVIQAVDELGAPCDPELATTEYAQVLKHLMGVADEVALGAVDQFTVAGQRRLGLVRVLSRHYVVALNLPAGAIEGRGHFHLRVAAPDLARHF